MRALACLSLAAVALSSLPAAAGPVACGRHEILIKGLADQFEEARHTTGLTGDGNLIEVFVSDTGTWTILVTSPAGVACVVAAGEAWETLAAAMGPEA